MSHGGGGGKKVSDIFLEWLLSLCVKRMSEMAKIFSHDVYFPPS